jgi:hypothetical protein
MTFPFNGTHYLLKFLTELLSMFEKSFALSLLWARCVYEHVLTRARWRVNMSLVASDVTMLHSAAHLKQLTIDFR